MGLAMFQSRLQGAIPPVAWPKPRPVTKSTAKICAVAVAGGFADFGNGQLWLAKMPECDFHARFRDQIRKAEIGFAQVSLQTSGVDPKFVRDLFKSAILLFQARLDRVFHIIGQIVLTSISHSFSELLFVTRGFSCIDNCSVPLVTSRQSGCISINRLYSECPGGWSCTQFQ